jgi:prepilin-type N-terminal cleavage/methylation domain-containing protein
MMRINSLSNKRGLTLLEFLIMLAIIAILVMAIIDNWPKSPPPSTTTITLNTDFRASLSVTPT